jgi:16S rRNA G966 N2-methylase RsmD
MSSSSSSSSPPPIQLLQHRKFGYLTELGLHSTNTSVYSSETPFHFKQLYSLFQPFFINKSKPVRVLDLTAHIGGFSLQLALSSSLAHITSLEIDQNAYDALKYNVDNLKLQNTITPIHIDATKWIEQKRDLRFDFIYIDPEWGGTNYKQYTKMELYLSQINITDIITRLHKLPCTENASVFLKVPFNYNFNNFPNSICHPIYSENPHKSVPDYFVLQVEPNHVHKK